MAQDDFLLGWTDFGRFAEALVFYQQVHLIGNHNNFKSLIRVCGSDVILELCRMGNLRIHYSENMIGVGTRNTSPSVETHGLVCIKAQNQSFENDATQFFEQYFGPSGAGFNKTLREFSKFVERFEYPKACWSMFNRILLTALTFCPASEGFFCP